VGAVGVAEWRSGGVVVWWSAETVATIVDLRQVQIVGFFWRDWREVQGGLRLGIGEGARPRARRGYAKTQGRIFDRDYGNPFGSVNDPAAAGRGCDPSRAKSVSRNRWR
jgi:hypothetical protein